MPTQAQNDQAAELAKKLANPVASLISVPLQYNYDEYGGANDGAAVSKLVIQPVIPFSLNEDWNLITRTLIPLDRPGGFPGGRAERIGPGRHHSQLLLFTEGADGRRLDLGRRAVVLAADGDRRRARHREVGNRADGRGLKQMGPWTVGMLAGHVWSVAGSDERADISVTTLQPFFSYTTKMHTTIGAYTESAYDWEAEQWGVPLISAGGATVQDRAADDLQFAVAGRYWRRRGAE